MNTTIINRQTAEQQTVTIERPKRFIINRTRGTVETITTVSHLKISPAGVPAVGYQQQIDDLNAQLPVKDVEVISETDLLANYLLNRGAI